MGAVTPVLMAVTAARSIAGYVGSRRQATAAQQQGNYESQLFSQNADFADAQAADAIARGHEAELRSRGQTRQLTGSQRASYAAQGISLDTGSPVDVVTQDEALGELDALTIRNNARREAYGFSTQASQYRSQAQMARTAGKNTAAAYGNEGVSTLLGGAADLYNVYAAYGINKAPRPPKAPLGGYNVFRK